MSPGHGRHRARTGLPTAMKALLVGACVVALVAAGLLITRPWEGGSTTAGPSGSGRPGSDPAGSDTPVVAVWTGTPNDPMVTKLAAKLGSSSYHLVAAGSESDADLLLTTGTTAGPAQVATTPVVLAMPLPMLQVAGTPTPQNLQAWMNGKKTWANQGKPGWGRFTLTVPDPKSNPLGAVAYGAFTTMVNGGPITGQPNLLQPSDTELAVLHAGQVMNPVATTQAADATLNASSVDAFAAKTSGVLTTEQAVMAHNGARGALPFVPVPLLGGVAAMPVNAAVAPKSDNRQTAAAVLRDLRSSAGAAALKAAGFRGPKGEAPDSPTAPKLTAPQFFSDTQLASARKGFAQAQRRNSILAVLDLSGSMNDDFSNSGKSKISLLKQLTALSYSVASPKSVSSVWFFASRGGKDEVYDEAPLAENDKVINGKPHATTVIAQTQQQTAVGGTPLYLAIERAYDYAVKHYTPGMTNQVLVLSDGADQDNFNSLSVDQTAAYVAQRYDPKKPVQLTLLLTSPKENGAELSKIAAAGHGRAVPVTSVADVPKIFAAALQS
ncbi:solute-binding protein [Flexivirga sp. ID2601S]|uniref:Solute-binding protein n=1 Tax=Flexivirga aerilata TaxID=1656889 RepID=A0A849AFC7_9MICO|nr:substrate-binding domain-containing protein [Flexivirga aerilata]NNG37888.1 solute-binding protein [Flexivirga aerilata]